MIVEINYGDGISREVAGNGCDVCWLENDDINMFVEECDCGDPACKLHWCNKASGRHVLRRQHRMGNVPSDAINVETVAVEYDGILIRERALYESALELAPNIVDLEGNRPYSGNTRLFREQWLANNAPAWAYTAVGEMVI